MRPAAVPLCASVGDCESSADEVVPALSPAQAFARPKSRTLTLPSGVTFTFRRLEVAMDHTFLVGFLECLGDLLRDGHRLVNRYRAALHALREVLAFGQLHHQEVSLSSVVCGRGLEAVEVGDARVVQ
jgi:hypothetical protein